MRTVCRYLRTRMLPRCALSHLADQESARATSIPARARLRALALGALSPLAGFSARSGDKHPGTRTPLRIKVASREVSSRGEFPA